MKNIKLNTVFASCLFLLLSCNNGTEATENTLLQEIKIPENFPIIVYPEGNEFSSSRWELGKELFFEKKMSRDSSISCASCHQSNLAFSDKIAFSQGVEKRLGTSNAPTLTNIAFSPYFNRDGGVPSLEQQILVPIQEHNEFDFNILAIAERLKQIPRYNKMSQKAYNRDIDYYVIPRAVATFQRSFISGNSRYDKVSLGKITFTEEEQKGKELFFSNKTNCSSCHSGFNFTSYKFENNGLKSEYAVLGRNRISKEESDIGKFKVPTLRNISFTSPYMHDGSIHTLEQVIEHYNNGGKEFINKSELIRPLNLSIIEKASIIAFLKTLNDEDFVKNPIFRK